MSVRKDYYWIKSGPAKAIFDKILFEEHKQAMLNAMDLAEELGGIGAGELSHPFHIFRSGMSAVVFKGKRAPSGWRKVKRFRHTEDAIGCYPKQNTNKGKEIAGKMQSVGNVRETSPMELYRLFVSDNDPSIVNRHYWYNPTAGYEGGRRIVVIPRRAEEPPRPAPKGCKRVEEWEVMKWKNEAESERREEGANNGRT